MLRFTDSVQETKKTRHSNYAAHRTVAESYRKYIARATKNVVWIWEAEAFTRTENEPMTVRRAKAFCAVLENSFLVHCPGDLLVGSGNPGKFAEPSMVNEADYQRALEVTKVIGRRHFGVFADHHAPDYERLVRDGIGGLLDRVAQSLADPAKKEEQRCFLESVRISLDGASRYCCRWADYLEQQSKAGCEFSDLMAFQAAMLKRLSTEAPATFHEALQLVLIFHEMNQLDSRSAMAFGRMDQYLLPFYESDREQGSVDDDVVTDLLSHFFAKITVDGDVQNIALGGVKPKDGENAVNPLSYLFLEACKRIGQPGGNCSARIDYEKTPRAFVRKCAEVIRTGIGYPAMINDRLTIEALLDCDYTLEDARNHCFVGCIEVFLQGKQAPWADGRQNSMSMMQPAVAWLAEHEATIPDEEKFERFYQTFMERVTTAVDGMLSADTAGQQPYQERASDYTSPFMSALVQDCIDRGRDMNDGGAIYPANKGFAIMGIASIADSLAAVRKLVCEERRFSAAELLAMLGADFSGFEAERRELLTKAPKFGNADLYVDSLADRVIRDLAPVFKRHRNAQGGQYWMLIASNVSNIDAGKSVGASPDGRKSGEPLSDASSPYYGRDQKGPTAVVRSIARLPYRLCAGGNVVNMKLDPKTLEGDEGLDSLAGLITTCFRLGGSELQFNTTDRETLLAAMEDPEHYEHLVVRVSGFSQHYTWLSKAVQRDILARTEHEL